MAQVEAIDFSPIAKLGEQAMEFSQRGQLRDIQRERLALAQQRQMQDIALRQQQEARQAETAKVDLAAKEFKNQEEVEKRQRAKSLQDYKYHPQYMALDPESKGIADDYLKSRIVQSAAGNTLVKTEDLDEMLTAMNSGTDLGIKHHTVLRNKANMAFGEAVGKLPKLREDAASGDPMAMAKLMKAEQEAKEFGAKALAANAQASAVYALIDKDKSLAEGRDNVQKTIHNLVTDDPGLFQRMDALSPGFVDRAVTSGDMAVIQEARDKVAEKEAKAGAIKLQQIKNAPPGFSFDPSTGEVSYLGEPATPEQLQKMAPQKQYALRDSGVPGIQRDPSPQRQTAPYAMGEGEGVEPIHLSGAQFSDLKNRYDAFKKRVLSFNSPALVRVLAAGTAIPKSLNELKQQREVLYLNAKDTKQGLTQAVASSGIAPGDSDLRIWNKFKQEFMAQTSDPKVAGFRSTLLATAERMATIYSGGSSVTSDYKIKLMKDLLDSSYSSKAFNSVIDAHSKALKDLTDVIDKAPTMEREAYALEWKKLSPQARNIVSREERPPEQSPWEPIPGEPGRLRNRITGQTASARK